MMTFSLLADLQNFRHGFTLRHPDVAVDVERAEAVAKLMPWHLQEVERLGFSPGSLCLAEQVHGSGVAVIHEAPAKPISGVDGILTCRPGLMVGIHVADCGAVYLADPVTGACGVLHSGKNGSQQGIAAVGIQQMQKVFGAKPEDIRVQLAPCIRPPAYEVDFAAQIRQSCLENGILSEHYADCGICTSSDLSRYYSYRVEKGRTGRMLALMGRL
ncbi:MAG: hypothetical protein RL015_2151 [Verrucomicrobiota bacterium]|jgi:copper oxidase (laccase) domain-containing protein